MSRMCDSCGKKTTAGRTYSHRGLAIRVGGIGIKITGISRRTFKPNVQRIRVLQNNGTIEREKICTQCVRAGKVKKPMKREIPDGLLARMQAKADAKSPAARRLKAKAAGDRRRARRAESAARMAKKKA